MNIADGRHHGFGSGNGGRPDYMQVNRKTKACMSASL